MISQEQHSERRRRRADGSEAGKGYFDSRYGANMLKVLPGQYRMAEKPGDMLVTVLGSCVSACIRNPATGFGGMNHFMLPESASSTSWGGADAVFRYGNHAMEVLINAVLRAGCRRENLEIKLFGGASVSNILSDVGQRNVDFVKTYLSNEGLRAVAVDLGGDQPRRIHYSPDTGKVQRLFLRRLDDSKAIGNEESRYRSTLRVKPEEGDVELFD